MSNRGARTVGASVHGRRARSLNSRILQLGALALSFIAVSVLVVTSSRAAFVAQNDNLSNQVTSAVVDLADNDSATAMFQNVTGLAPGATQQRCIDVTYTGTVDPLPVRLFAAGAPTAALAPYLDLTVQIGSDPSPSFGDCTGFVSAGTVWTGTLADFATTHGTYAAGATTWDPGTTSPSTRTFRFALSVQDDAAAEGLTTTFGFTWETRTS
jgi:hypothetical protein